MRIGTTETTIRLRMKHKFVYISILIIGFVCLSCEKREAYYRFSELQKDMWSKLDTIYFDIDSLSVLPNVPYDVTVELVNNSDYPYQNIWLYILDDFESYNFTLEEKQYELADKLGKWHGSGFGSLYQLPLLYKKDVVFREKRNYRLKVVHGMRDEPLQGIEKIGLKIESTQK